jgi:hypothetical protein
MYLLAFLLLLASNIEMDSYYIHFERSGGFAGITQTLELKSDTLSLEDQDHLRKLIDTSAFFDLKEETGSGAPDQFNYKITIKSEQKERTFETGDVSMPDKLRPLVNYLTDKMRRSM